MPAPQSERAVETRKSDRAYPHGLTEPQHTSSAVAACRTHRAHAPSRRRLMLEGTDRRFQHQPIALAIPAQYTKPSLATSTCIPGHHGSPRRCSRPSRYAFAPSCRACVAGAGPFQVGAALHDALLRRRSSANSPSPRSVILEVLSSTSRVASSRLPTSSAAGGVDLAERRRQGTRAAPGCNMLRRDGTCRNTAACTPHGRHR